MNVNKEIAIKIHEIVKGEAEVSRFYDFEKSSYIDIYTGRNRPFSGVNTYGTIGLCDYNIDKVLENKKNLRIEFIGAAKDEYTYFPNIISTCAFYIINDRYSCEPGTVYPEVISEYYSGYEMKHILFVSPFLWEKRLKVETDCRTVVWLMPIPISNEEFDYLKENGSEALELLFEESEINIFDLERASVL